MQILKIGVLGLGLFLIISLIAYLMMAFIQSEFNTFLWSKDTRIMLVGFICLATCFIPLIIIFITSEL